MSDVFVSAKLNVDLEVVTENMSWTAWTRVWKGETGIHFYFYAFLLSTLVSSNDLLRCLLRKTSNYPEDALMKKIIIIKRGKYAKY